MTVTIYYDYVCPYVYRVGVWLDLLVEQGVDVRPAWRYFSLTQINNKEPDWYVWQEPVDNPRGWQEERRLRGLRAQWAAEAARQQGAEVFRRFHLALLKAIHEEGLSLDGDQATRHAAESAALDLARWEQDRQDLTFLDAIRRDHEAATAQGIFGTPTFVFDGALPAYLKLTDVPRGPESRSYWEEFSQVVAARPLFREIKRLH
ncbi:MAG: DsbA family oxidoreductase [Ardenticatenaceae bacterium]